MGENLDKNKNLEEALNTLDREYFQVAKKYDTDGNIAEWRVFWWNMNDNDFIEDSNKPLLDSKYNSVNDIYKLADEFLKNKKRATENVFWESVELTIINYNTQFDIEQKLYKFSSTLGWIIIIINFIFVVLQQTKLIPSALGSLMVIMFCLIYLMAEYTIIFCKKVVESKIEDSYNDLLELIVKVEMKYRKRGYIPKIRRKIDGKANRKE